MFFTGLPLVSLDAVRGARNARAASLSVSCERRWRRITMDDYDKCTEGADRAPSLFFAFFARWVDDVIGGVSTGRVNRRAHN